jgi:DNA-binding NarL/FixJ family response regulator
MSSLPPDASAFDTCRRIREQAPSVRVVLLVARADERAVVAGVRAGAISVLSPRAPLTEIARAVRAAASGSSVLDAAATAALLQYGRDQGAEPDGLTELERHVLALVAHGLTNRAIAHELAIGDKSVKNHLSRAFPKLNASRRAQAAVLFLAGQHGAVGGGDRPDAA